MKQTTALALGCCLLFPSFGRAEDPAPRPLATAAEARRQAEILHEAMHASLHYVHHGYYREDEGLPIPAAVLKEAFAHIEETQQVKLRWLVVEGQAMNVDHRPQNDQEKAAVAALKAGEQSHIWEENGHLRRAGAITLSSHCLKCHVPERKNTDDHTAGLIISIPLGDNMLSQ